MSYYEGLSCPVCLKVFTSHDDIVVCPQCGLPHHRACWKSVGHCYEQDRHGTEQQWSRQRAQAQPTASSVNKNVCNKCQFENAQYAEFCSRCGTQLVMDDWHSHSDEHSSEYTYAPNSGGFSPFSSETIENVNVAELDAIVGTNSAYYLDRFRRIERKQGGGWNWAAFLLSPFWLFYRKQYLLGTCYLLVYLITNITYSLVSFSLQGLEVETITTDIMIATMQKHILFYPCMVLLGIWLTMKIVIALKGNAYYFSHCKKKIKSAKSETSDLSLTELSTYGGVSTGMAVLFFAISETVIFVAEELMIHFLI